MFRSQTYPGTRPFIHALLFRCPPAGFKRVTRITWEAAGKITAVVRVTFSFHSNLFPIVELRNSPDAQRECRVHHRPFESRAIQRHETRRIVIVYQGRDFQGIRIKCVIFQLIAKSPHGQLFCEYPERNTPQGKIKNRIKFGVSAIPARVATDEESGLGRIALEYLPYHPHLWVLTMEGVGEIAYETARHVLDRILTNPIYAGGPDPPKRVLYLVTSDFRLFLVHIG